MNTKTQKKNSSMNSTNILSPKPHNKTNSSGSPFNINNKNLYNNNYERVNKLHKKENSSKKNKNKLKNSEVLINNYLSQRSRLNTEENEININKLKFSYNFFRNKIENSFKPKNNRSNSKKINQKNSNFENTNNFKSAKKIRNTKNSQNINKKNNANNHITRSKGSTTKKMIEENSHLNEYTNTNIHNRSNTQTYFRKSNIKASSNTHNLANNSSKYRKTNKSEGTKKRNQINRVIKDSKISPNFSGVLRQISPLYASNDKLSNIQNYFRNISYKNKNILNTNKAKQYSKERKILITEPKELNNTNKIDTEDFVLKDNSSYLVISKKPAQITNFIEKKENNKYINNYFNICENQKGEIGEKDLNKYITFEEIHFFFIKQIQMGNKLNVYMNCHKS